MRFISFIVLALSVTACGSGGDSSGNSSSIASSVSSGGGSSAVSSVAAVAPESAPANFTLQLGPIKQFNFSWNAVEGADYYQLLENADGVSGFTQVVNDIEDTSYDHEVALYLRTHARYLVRACNAAGCSNDSEEVSVAGNLANAVGYVKAPVTLGAVTSMNEVVDSQRFGNTVALSGDGMTLAVATDNDLAGTTDTNGEASALFAQGGAAVYVFTKADTGWQQTGIVNGLSAEVDALALSENGELLAIGLGEESGGSIGINGNESNQSATRSGAVYLYRGNDGWTQEAYIKASNASENDLFGSSLALSADGATLAVGALAERGLAAGVNGNEALFDSDYYFGAAYVFIDGENGWEQEAYIKTIGDDGNPEGRSRSFGDAVALSADGSVMAVGSPGSNLSSSGELDDTTYSAVHLYRKVAGQWQSDALVNSPEPTLQARFGTSVALSADGAVLAVGEDHALSFNDLDLFNKGSVHTYVYADEQWAFQATLLPENGIKRNGFGGNIAMAGSGDLVAVCAPVDHGDSVALAPDSGAETLSQSGAAYVFAEQDGQWKQKSFIKAPNPGEYDDFCSSLGLSANGLALAIGAAREDGSATGVGGEMNNNAVDTGAVYLY